VENVIKPAKPIPFNFDVLCTKPQLLANFSTNNSVNNSENSFFTPATNCAIISPSLAKLCQFFY
jgi:hypothetical protein